MEGWVGHERGEGPAHLVEVQVGRRLRSQQHEHEPEVRQWPLGALYVEMNDQGVEKGTS